MFRNYYINIIVTKKYDKCAAGNRGLYFLLKASCVNTKFTIEAVLQY